MMGIRIQGIHPLTLLSDYFEYARKNALAHEHLSVYVDENILFMRWTGADIAVRHDETFDEATTYATLDDMVVGERLRDATITRIEVSNNCMTKGCNLAALYRDGDGHRTSTFLLRANKCHLHSTSQRQRCDDPIEYVMFDA